MTTPTPKQPKATSTGKIPLDERIAESEFVRKTEEYEAEMRRTEKPAKPALPPSVKSPD